MIVPDRALVESRYTRRVAKRRDALKGMFLYQMELFEVMMFVPSSFGSDFCSYETREEAVVGQELAGLCLRVPSWRGIADYHEDATLWQLLRFLPHHMTTKMRADSFRFSTVRLERRVRARHETMAQWYQLEVEGTKESQQTRA